MKAKDEGGICTNLAVAELLAFLVTPFSDIHRSPVTEPENLIGREGLCRLPKVNEAERMALAGDER